MIIKNHGRWIARNDIDSSLMGHPPNVLMIVREGDATDWYRYQPQFAPDTVKAAVYDGRIINAVVDVSMICPADHLLIEISDGPSDPDSYRGREYNAATNELV